MSRFDDLKAAELQKLKAEEAQLKGWLSSNKLPLIVGFLAGLVSGILIGMHV